jgi:aryl-alcohol dehydrogenase-like predicted oxidoreductase
MTKRKLGNSGLEVSPVCFGGNVFGWTADEKTSFELLDAWLDAGFNFVDTADVYSKWAPGNRGGESESVIGNWLKRSGKRKDVVIATKVGMEMDRKGLSRKYILAEAEESLKRLQTDYIDLYQSHADDPATSVEETLGAYATLIQQGKVRAIGASNYEAPRLSEAIRISEQNGLPRYQSLQPNYNLYDRADYESGLERVCQENGLGVIPYFSLASGFLTGKYRSEKDLESKSRAGMVKKFLTDRGRRILSVLDELSRELNSTPAQISLAWLIARPSITAPIASATSLSQLKELVAAASLRLDDSAIDRLNRASAETQQARV